MMFCRAVGAPDFEMVTYYPLRFAGGPKAGTLGTDILITAFFDPLFLWQRNAGTMNLQLFLIII
jgi:hypothetical protein